ncbi:MAG: response regulator [Bacteriovoracaceae bacterium]|nr:response regulator [Bacteriovoracaceae bacterium]
MEKILLIVDDSKEIIEVVSNILEELFDKVVSANSVEEAKNRLQNNQFSFIVLDINLVGHNGAEVVKYLVDHPENLNNGCPVLILSGIINNQFIEKFGSRFAAVVMKPFNHQTLLETVRAILGGKITQVTSLELPEIPCILPFPIPQLEQKVKGVMEQVKKNAKLKQLFGELTVDRSGDNFMLTHIGMLINISTGICNKLEWTTDKTLEKFVYAAYLHDMAISDRSDLAKFKGNIYDLEMLKTKLSPQDYKLLFDHSNLAAKKIEMLPEIPPDVAMIVRQHHELPNEKGYPAKLSFNKITPLSSVFIVAHDLTHYILDNPQWTMKDYLLKVKTKFKGAHFARILSGLGDMR